MSYIDELIKAYNLITKDQYMKTTARILFTAITIFLIIIMGYFAFNLHTGNHLKIWVLEEGHDTIIKVKPEIVYKDRHDTVYQIKYVRAGSPVNNTKIDHPDKVEIGTTH